MKSKITLALSILISLGITACHSGGTGAIEPQVKAGQTVTDNSKALAAAQAEADKAKAEATAAQAELTKLKKALADAEQDASSAKKAQANAEAAAIKAEAAAEAAKQAAIKAQAEAEQSNLSALEAEKKRLAAEQAQLAAEQAKTEAEQARIIAEQAKLEAEAKRLSAEKAAASAEEKAQIEEQEKQLAEQKAKLAEEAKALETQAKQEAEEKAKLAEEAKKLEEQAKKEAEAKALAEEQAKKAAEEEAKKAEAEKAAAEAEAKRLIKEKSQNYVVSDSYVTNDDKKIEIATAINNNTKQCEGQINTCISAKANIANDTIIFTDKQSYSGYAVVRTGQITAGNPEPINAYVAVAKTATTDKDAVVDATYKGNAAYTTGNLFSVIGVDNTGSTKGQYVATLNVKDQKISGGIENTNAAIATKRAELNQDPNIITFKESQVEVRDDMVGFKGDAQFNYGWGFMPNATGDGKGTYQGVFAGEKAEEVIGTFSTDDTSPKNSVQGAFMGTK